ncbi:MAG: polyhydroxyalkanoate depolymerase [Alphaproteobacteria bacterium]|nr:polyhydroxyalkanoate depolymerase [Alphaproteobacteria bacterium]MBO6864618.1 polyhydroxyalkanoate depolymerase [Alphaproteobacteria bacterium]MEC9266149.1 polyhydroxyalkanoate depolymerase [Pseudomonadota bacterium]
MLYSMYDARSRALAPVRLMAEATRLTFVNPFHPLSWTPLGRMMAAGSGVIESLLAERGKPEWGIDEVSVDGTSYPVEIEPVLEQPFGDLVRFKKAGFPRPQSRILLVAPMSGHFATLLRDTVRALLIENEVWITDWRDAAQVPKSEGRFGVDAYMQYLMDFLAHLHAEDPRPVHIMAVCQPAPLVLATVALLAEEKAPHCPASMVLMGGPVDTRAASTVVTQVAENRSIPWFERHVIHRVPARFPGANRKVYPGFLQLRAFWSMNPARHAGAHWSMYKHLVRGDGESAERTQAFYDEYMAVADVAADFFLETVDHVFRRHSLPKGEMMWKGRLVRPETIRDVGLMTVEGELDDISAPAQTEAAHDICPNIPEALREHLLQENVGHYGIFNGRRWREQICPQIGAFVRRMEAGDVKQDAA